MLLKHSPSGMLDEVRRASCIDFGIMPGREAYRLVQLLGIQHFTVRSEDASFTSHFPMVAGSGVVIEDAADAEAFCLLLIQEGAAVQEVEA